MKSYAVHPPPTPSNSSNALQPLPIAAASVGVRHRIIRSFQIEPGAHAQTREGFEKDSYIFHYTYGIEYRLNGQPQGFNTIGEWSLDKRHYGGSYPPRKVILRLGSF